MVAAAWVLARREGRIQLTCSCLDVTNSYNEQFERLPLNTWNYCRARWPHGERADLAGHLDLVNLFRTSNLSLQEPIRIRL